MSGCTVTRAPWNSQQTGLSGFAYIPIDPFPVYISYDTAAPAEESRKRLTPGEVLQLLPDNAVRIAIEQFDAKGGVSYGPVSTGVAGGNYRVTVDYINADTTSFPVVWRRIDGASAGHIERTMGLGTGPDTSDPPRSSGPRYEVHVLGFLGPEDFPAKDGWATYNIPMYIGIGLRVTADVSVMSGRVNISGLGILGAEAEANRLSGSLLVQTLGVNGKSISAALPIQSELNRTTVQNAIVSVGAIKALLYEAETTIMPRVVGMYLPFEADKALVNAIISEMSRKPPQWYPPVAP